MTSAPLSRSLRARLGPGGCLCVLVALVIQMATRPPVLAEQQPVVPGAPLKRDISGGQTHAYQLSLGSEECVRVAVQQHGVDVTIALRDQNAQLLRQENRSSERGTEFLVWTSPGPGLYQIAVSAPAADAPAAPYQLLVETRPADDSCKAAFQRYAEASALLQQSRSASTSADAKERSVLEERLRSALSGFSDTLPYWKATADRELTAVTLHQMGYLNGKLKDVKSAIARYEEAVELFREIGDRTEEALVLNDIGAAYGNQGDYTRASEYLTAALALVDALPQNDAADLTFNYAVILQNQSRHQEALALFHRARDRFRALGRKNLELQAVSEIGRTYYATGAMIQSLEYATEGLSLSRTSSMPLLEARFAQDIARVYLYLDDYDQARDYCERALRLFRSEQYVNGEIATLLLLGDADYARKDNAGAQSSYERAAALAAANQFKEAEARAAVRLGTLLSEHGDYAGALDYRQRALAFYRATGNARSEVNTLLALGRTYRQMGTAKEAGSSLQQALAISTEKAGGFAETSILGELALLARDQGHLEDAHGLLTKLLERFDAERRSLVAPGLSAAFISGAQNWYEVGADLLMRLHGAQPRAGYDRQAWVAAERAKAWGLLEMLAEERTDVHQGVDRVLLEQRRRLWAEMSARAAASQRTLDRGGSGTEPSGHGPIDDLAARLHVAEAKLRASSPRYVDLVEPLPVAASELQHGLLDSETVLLEFVLGDAQSWLWAITHATFDSYKLPPRAEIDAAARRVYEMLTARQPARGPRQPPHGRRIADADAELSVAAARLSRLLLASIEPRLRKAWRGKRLVIVASGSLEYVPFGILPLSSGHRLLTDHEVVNLPSATVLAALRREASQRPPATRTLALIADPVFDPSDPRVHQQRTARATNRTGDPVMVAAAGRPAVSDAALRRAASGFTRDGFARLPFSREEVAGIAELVPRHSVLQATDFQASRALVVGDQLSQYRFVHFATHGMLNSRHPELSGLVLSLVDEKGRPQNGFLRLQEIYDLRLGADVVVLSACQTALGKEIKGEGIVGLTRGFMYAGAQRIVASLWQVDDLATSHLMKAFYRGMLKDGLRPAAALRAAQLDMMAQERWAAPYYWAAFTLQGDWR